MDNCIGHGCRTIKSYGRISGTVIADTKFLSPPHDRFNGLQTVFAELQKMLSIMNRGRVFIYDRERGNSGMILRQNAI